MWRTWQVVEQKLTGAEPARGRGEAHRWPPVPERTQRRWRARWLRPVRFLAQVLATSGEATWVGLAGVLSPTATCADLVAVYAATSATTAGHLLEAVAALVYRLQPTVRLM